MWSEVSKDIFGELILVYITWFLSHKHGFPLTVLFIKMVPQSKQFEQDCTTPVYKEGYLEANKKKN
jgi:hypothetical protein